VLVPLVVYSVLRLALFAVVLAGLWRAGMGGWLAVVVAAFAAWALSYVLLAGPRDGAARWLADRAAARKASGRRFSSETEEDAAVEDAEAAAVQQSGDDGQSARPSASSTP
jgi:hypothetical protein